MKSSDEHQGVAYMKVALLPEEFADGDVSRTPKWFLNPLHQLFVEEERGAFVRKDNNGLREVAAIFVDKVGGYVSEESIIAHRR